MSETHFSALDWRPGKGRKTYVRVRRSGGQKVAPSAFLAAARVSGIGSGKHRQCSAKRVDGQPCRGIAMRDAPTCKKHGGAAYTAQYVRPYVRQDGVVVIPKHAKAKSRKP